MLNINNLKHPTTQDKIKKAMFSVIKKATKQVAVHNSKGGLLVLITYNKNKGFNFYAKKQGNITELILKSLKSYGTL